MSALELVNQFVAQHHLVPIGALILGVQRVARPALVDLRAFLVTALAIGLAVSAKFGVTELDVEAQRTKAEKVLPGVPEVPSAASLLEGLNGGAK